MMDSTNCCSSAANAMTLNTNPNDNTPRCKTDDRLRMKISLERSVPMMRDVPPPDAMPFRAQMQFIACLLV